MERLDLFWVGNVPTMSVIRVQRQHEKVTGVYPARKLAKCSLSLKSNVGKKHLNRSLVVTILGISFVFGCSKKGTVSVIASYVHGMVGP